ncbi:MAG: hypothetical protein ACYTG7_16035 [Planctomycetota bacterium]|jgi:hypothetical protein
MDQVYRVRMTGLIDNSSVYKVRDVRFWEREFDPRKSIEVIEELLAEPDPPVNLSVSTSATDMHPGGTLDYTVILANRTDQAQAFFGFVEEIQPDGERVPLHGPFPLVLKPSAQADVKLSETFSRFELPGSYTLVIKIGGKDGVWEAERIDFKVH